MAESTKLSKASEVINAIQELINKHGDLPLCVVDADTGWLMKPSIEFEGASNYSFNKTPILTITYGYGDSADV